MTQADLAATGQPVPQPLSVVRVTCRWCHWCPVRCSPARVENFSPVFKFGTHHGLVTVGLWASKRHWEQCGRGSSGSLFCYLSWSTFIGMRPSNQLSVWCSIDSNAPKGEGQCGWWKEQKSSNVFKNCKMEVHHFLRVLTLLSWHLQVVMWWRAVQRSTSQNGKKFFLDADQQTINITLLGTSPYPTYWMRNPPSSQQPSKGICDPSLEGRTMVIFHAGSKSKTLELPYGGAGGVVVAHDQLRLSEMLPPGLRPCPCLLRRSWVWRWSRDGP